MQLTIQRTGALLGTVTPPGDKSLSHRTALLAALAEGDSQIENYLVAGVTARLLQALTALNVPWHLEGTTLTVSGCGLDGLEVPASPIDCGNSATTLRLLTGALAAAGLPVILDGSEGLRRRPMRRIVAPLQAMGVPIIATGDCAPLHLSPRQAPTHGITYSLPVASAQVKSCLLLAGLTAQGPTRLYEPGPSRDHTERLLHALGVEIGWGTAETPTAYWTHLTPPPELHLPSLQLRLPGDFSAAAFLIVAALITPGSQVTIREVGLNPTRTGLLDVLLEMGAEISIQNQGERHGEPLGDLVVRHSSLVGTRVAGERVVRMIDEFPAFAIAAANAAGPTVVSEAVELRHKESDRISALCSELHKLGITADETPDGFCLPGNGIPSGGRVEAHGDHRLAMALALAGLVAPQPVTVAGTEMIGESFPNFSALLAQLGASIQPG